MLCVQCRDERLLQQSRRDREEDERGRRITPQIFKIFSFSFYALKVVLLVKISPIWTTPSIWVISSSLKTFFFCFVITIYSWGPVYLYALLIFTFPQKKHKNWIVTFPNRIFSYSNVTQPQLSILCYHHSHKHHFPPLFSLPFSNTFISVLQPLYFSVPTTHLLRHS